MHESSITRGWKEELECSVVIFMPLMAGYSENGPR